MKSPLFFCGWGFKPEFFDELDIAVISWDVIAWSLGIARLVEFLRANSSVNFNSLLLVACQESFPHNYLDEFITAFRKDPYKEMLRFYRKAFWKRQACFERFKRYLYTSPQEDFFQLETELLELTSCEVDLKLIKETFREITVVVPIYDLIIAIQRMRKLASLLGATLVEIAEPHFCFCSSEFMSILEERATMIR